MEKEHKKRKKEKQSFHEVLKHWKVAKVQKRRYKNGTSLCTETTYSDFAPEYCVITVD